MSGKAIAKIIKKGSQWCVVSESGKNLGCSKTKDGALKRLKQVEFFKNKGSGMTYDKLFEKLGADYKISDTENKTLIPGGSIAGQVSPNILDDKEHFPVITTAQAVSSINRAIKLTDVPVWYNGTLNGLRNEVYAGIAIAHPGLDINVSVPVDQVLALSDGQEESETSREDVKDPVKNLIDKVPQVDRPTLAANLAEVASDEENRKVMAGDLMQMLEAQKEALENAMKVAKRLMKKGLTAEEFEGLISFLQEDILRSLLNKGATASAIRRQELIDRLTAKTNPFKEPQKPTDGEDDKKKKKKKGAY
jgi:hypothetical protein